MFISSLTSLVRAALRRPFLAGSIGAFVAIAAALALGQHPTMARESGQ